MGDSKAYLIALAAFAMTATGVHAYGGSKILSRAGLTEQQVEAFETAHELRRAGDVEKARDVLVEAGVTEETILAIKQAAKAVRQSVHEAVKANDFAAFRVAVADSPLGDIVTTEADFAEYVRAHALIEAGDRPAAMSIFATLGVPQLRMRGMYHGQQQQQRSELSEDEQAALLVAKQANDRAVVRAILEDAGVPGRGKHHER